MGWDMPSATLDLKQAYQPPVLTMLGSFESLT
jgi:hypothetical protein